MDVRVTDVPLCSASTSLRAFSAVQATSANCVLIRSTTTGPCASICWTIVVTCKSCCVLVVVRVELCCVVEGIDELETPDCVEVDDVSVCGIVDDDVDGVVEIEPLP